MLLNQQHHPFVYIYIFFLKRVTEQHITIFHQYKNASIKENKRVDRLGDITNVGMNLRTMF